MDLASVRFFSCPWPWTCSSWTKINQVINNHLRREIPEIHRVNDALSWEEKKNKTCAHLFDRLAPLSNFHVSNFLCYLVIFRKENLSITLPVGDEFSDLIDRKISAVNKYCWHPGVQHHWSRLHPKRYYTNRLQICQAVRCLIWKFLWAEGCFLSIGTARMHLHLRRFDSIGRVDLPPSFVVTVTLALE